MGGHTSIKGKRRYKGVGVVRSMVHLRNQEVSVMAGAWGEKVKGQAMRWGGRWGTGSHRVLQVFTKGGAPAHTEHLPN